MATNANKLPSPLQSGNSDVVENHSAGYQKRIRLLAILSFYLLIVVSCMTPVVQPRNSVIELLLRALISSAATYGCVIDARIRSRPLMHITQLIMFFSWPISVSVYFIYSRKLRGLGLWTLFVIAFFVVVILASLLAHCLKYGVWTV